MSLLLITKSERLTLERSYFGPGRKGYFVQLTNTRKKQRDILGQILKQMDSKGMKYNPSFGRKCRTTEETG